MESAVRVGAVKRLGCVVGLLGLLAGLAGPAGAAPKRSSRPPARKPARKSPSLPPARPAPGGLVRLQLQEEALREKIARLERELAESRAREEQTAAKLAEAELLLGRTPASTSESSSRLATLVELYRRLEAIERDLAGLTAGSAQDREKIQALKSEQDAIFAWFRAALGDSSGTIVVAQRAPAGPTPEALRAVELARAAAAAAQRDFDRIQRAVTQGLLPRAELLRAQSELARAQADLARAEARVKNDPEAERNAARALVKAAEAEFAAAEADLQRLHNLQKAGAVAAVEVNAAGSRLQKARSALEAARADLKRLETAK